MSHNMWYMAVPHATLPRVLLSFLPVISLCCPSSLTWRSYSFSQCPSDFFSSHPFLPSHLWKSGSFLPLPPHSASTWRPCGTLPLCDWHSYGRYGPGWGRALTSSGGFGSLFTRILKARPPRAWFCAFALEQILIEVVCGDRAGWPRRHFFCTLTGRITHISTWRLKILTAGL